MGLYRDMGMHEFRHLVNPYLIHLSQQGALCPRCHAVMRLEPAAYSPDGALWHCPECGFHGGVEMAPEFAHMDMDEAIRRDKEMDGHGSQPGHASSGLQLV